MQINITKSLRFSLRNTVEKTVTDYYLEKTNILVIFRQIRHIRVFDTSFPSPLALR